ncbi:uncharacterized protein LOC115067366 isoform X3 [Nannospalax galili]|uniref:uncharacterized protein LOC115067366 isoform X3 n=1 Tax=Nannospalax galili TaxID=1026970 RepID=UPI00111C6C08|nr:uncharacterized protein LOC115067366 isoform X3 [Nannospalax galili]
MKFFSVTFGGECSHSSQRMPTLMAVRRPCNTMLRGTTGPSARGVHSGSGITLLELLNDGHIPAPTVAPGGQRASQGQLVRDCHGRSKRIMLHCPQETLVIYEVFTLLFWDWHFRPLKRDQKEHRKETRHHISAAGVRRTKTLPLRTVGSLKGRLCVAVSRLFTSTHTSSLKPD